MIRLTPEREREINNLRLEVQVVAVINQLLFEIGELRKEETIYHLREIELRQNNRELKKALEGLTNAALAGIKPLQSQMDAGFYVLNELNQLKREG